MKTEIILAIITPIVGWFVSVVLMKRKYNAEVEKLKADIETITTENSGVKVDNTQKLIDIIVSNVVEPLEKEMKKLRISNTRLTRAIDKISDCPVATPDKCPVKIELRRQDADTENEEKCEKS